MKIAVLIGVDKYEHLQNLPGCRNDLDVLEKLLKASKEFQIVERFGDSDAAASLKQKLINFFKKNENNDVTELFFYFTGHGSFKDNDFYYLLSDFHQDKRRQTSLENSEVDKLIKSLKPELVTKVIDACQSGTSYVKSDDKMISKYFESTQQDFRKCYFLHSSMSNQSSYQDDEISAFTRSFLGSIYADSGVDVRYKSIIDYISDDFQSITNQTPFFVAQADFTEVFLKVNDDVKACVSGYCKLSQELGPTEPQKQEESNQSFVDKIKVASQEYVSMESAVATISEVSHKLEKIKPNKDISELYSTKITKSKYISGTKNAIEIGKWLRDNKSDFFAAATFETESYEEERRISGFSLADMMLPRTVTRYRDVISGFDSTVPMPIKAFFITQVPRFPNISKYEWLMPFIISRKEVKFFYAFTDYRDSNWSDSEINENFNWRSAEFQLRDNAALMNFIEATYIEFEQFIIDMIKRNIET